MFIGRRYNCRQSRRNTEDSEFVLLGEHVCRLSANELNGNLVLSYVDMKDTVYQQCIRIMLCLCVLLLQQVANVGCIIYELVCLLTATGDLMGASNSYCRLWLCKLVLAV